MYEITKQLSLSPYGPDQGPALTLAALSTQDLRFTLSTVSGPLSLRAENLPAVVLYRPDGAQLYRCPYSTGTGWTEENLAAGLISFRLDGYDPALLAVDGRNPLQLSWALVWSPDGAHEQPLIRGALTFTPYFIVKPPDNVVPGSQWYTGTGAPSLALGRAMDLYLNTADSTYYQRSSTAWDLKGQLTGQGGTPGAPGAVWYTGAGAPNVTIGVNGDLYLDTATGNYYQKTANTWQIRGQLTGPAGPQGSRWITGSGTPAPLLGDETDMYLDVLSNQYYQKQSGAWVLKGSLVGGLALQRYSFRVNFDGQGNPQGIDGSTPLPAGWTTTVSGSNLTVNHTVGHPPIQVTYLGISGALVNYRYPTAANPMTLPVSNQGGQFTLALSSSVAGAAAGSSALVTLLF